MKVVAIIPARYGSTRFEGKPLAPILGKSMIQRVYEGVCKSRIIEDVIVATDDQRILAEVQRFGGKGVMTSPTHPTGTDRLAEVARRMKAAIIVNVQGDEPLIDGRIVDRAIRPLLNDRTLPMSTLMTPIDSLAEWINPNVVKLVVDRQGFALYFSRSPIPFPRDLHTETLLMGPPREEPLTLERMYRHIGVYVYRRSFLLKFARMKPTPLETLEKLEQLRALENGFRIKVTLVNYKPLHVDTPEDLKNIVNCLSQAS
jgi:3-deoxy-manno-octulosonate cytidylyltransferase (CMP-KDO synthetase)